jgi:hypothetical protein
MSFKVGDRVLFGRTHGEKTLGEVVKVNPKKLKVKQLESRGTMRDYPVGTLWAVPLTLVFPVAAQVAKAIEATPTPPKRDQSEIMKDILSVYCGLSPENLSCDGELSRSQVAARAKVLNTKLNNLFREIGRTVSETEAWNNHDLNRACGV